MIFLIFFGLLFAASLVGPSTGAASVSSRSPEGSMTAGEFFMNYYISEELPVGTLVGNVVVDFGLDLKYETEMLSRLRFHFLQTHRQKREIQTNQYRFLRRRRRHGGSRLSGSGSDWFTIDERSGVIRTNLRIDRETMCTSATWTTTSSSMPLSTRKLSSGTGESGDVCVLKLDVAVVQLPADFSATHGAISVAATSLVQVLGVRVEILDINDHSPAFPYRNWDYQISEAAEPGTEFAIPSAVDLDGNSRNNGIRLYRIEDQTHSQSHIRKFNFDNVDWAREDSISGGRYNTGGQLSPFQLKVAQSFRREEAGLESSVSGGNSRTAGLEVVSEQGRVIRLVLNQRLDREQVTSHVIIVTAVDGGSPARTGTMTVVIEVLDANDNRPEFSQRSYEVWVKETTPIGSVILTVEATDRDEARNGRVIYALAPVQILNDDVNTEAQQRHLAAYQKKGGMGYDNERQPFGIGPETGRIYIKRELDYETTSAYALTVTASDCGPDSLSAFASVTVHIDDVNDNRPIIAANALLSSVGPVSSSGSAVSMSIPEVSEDAMVGTLVAHVTATDRDSGRNGHVRCKMAENELGNDKVGSMTTFELVQLYGGGTEYQLVTATRLDREIKSEYRLVITCHDDGSPRPLSSSLDVTVSVTDINDCRPVFELPMYSATIYENNDIGATVLQVRATDEDSGVNGRLVYRLERSEDFFDDLGRFVQIDHDSGLVTMRASMNRETTDYLAFDVVAEDGGSQSLTGRTKVRVTVLDRDDEKPMFESAFYLFTVEENQPVGTSVGTVQALDKDLPPFNSLVYHIERYTSNVSDITGKNSNLVPFSIDAKSGVLKTAAIFDREVTSTYQFQVSTRPTSEVSGGLHESPVATASITVNVVDVNDNDPRFVFPLPANQSLHLELNGGASTASAVVTLTGKPTLGQVVAKLRAYDPDSSENALFRFGLASSPEPPPASCLVAQDAQRLRRDFDLSPSTGLISVSHGLTNDFGSTNSLTSESVTVVENDVITRRSAVLRRRLQLVVCDAERPDIVSDRATLDVVYLKTTDPDGTGDDVIASAALDGRLLASERLLLILSCILCAVLLAAIASIVLLCVLRSPGFICSQPRGGSARLPVASRTTEVSGRCGKPSSNDSDVDYGNCLKTAAHGFKD